MILDNFSTIVAAIINHLWQSTLFAAAMAGMALVLRENQAQVRYRLWLAASVKFLVPFSMLISLGERLATLSHLARTQPIFYLILKSVGQPFHHSAGFRGMLLVTVLPYLSVPLVLVWLGGFGYSLKTSWFRWRRVLAAMHAAAVVFEGREVQALRRVELAAGIGRPIVFRLSESPIEPGVFGIVRPSLLWPVRMSDQLEDAHLESILAHEVQHVQRRDNLGAAMHMLVESIFWFYPLVWWIGAHMLEERETACDDAVLQSGFAPEMYAQSILKTCEFCITSPLACVSGVTGGDLRQRMVRIMTQRSAQNLSLASKCLLVVIGIGTVASPIIFGLIQARSAVALPLENHSGLQASDPGRIYRVGNGVSAPKLVFAPDPKFSEEALRAKFQGVCVLSLIVDAQGKPQRVQVVRHLGMGLDAKAVEAVRQYKFTPAVRVGQPVAVEVNIEVNFQRY